ncbi:MAG: methylmalonyl-CoA mutase family protein [Paracoccaceae bacterium]
MSKNSEIKDEPWLFRTYAGHSSAEESNNLFRNNLAKGQTGLSVAFDLPTQTGYDSDHPLANGEVGKVGVPICHLGDMRRLFDKIPIEKMNTSMTINATAPWLLALYIAIAEEREIDISDLKGTVQNDIIKEYLSRGTYIFPPKASMKLIGDVTEYCLLNIPKWNPINICSYHLQEAGCTPEQELAFALSTGIAVLDQIKDQIPNEDFETVVGRISFFVNAGIRFVTEVCKMRAFADLWDEICRDRYKVKDKKARRFRYGVQVNSLGLTEQQPENNVFRILIEMLAVTLSKNSRARAIQLPAWNEAMGLPRPWDQQWSLRMQQILAYETDLLEFDDIFDGNKNIDKKVNELKNGAKKTIAQIDKMGGALSAIEFMKTELVKANTERLRSIENGNKTIVGVNKFKETDTSPLTNSTNNFLFINPEAQKKQINILQSWKKNRDEKEVKAALNTLEKAARTGKNIIRPSIEAAKAGVTTGEWGSLMRSIHGEYRAPTGISSAISNNTTGLEGIKEEVDKVSRKLGRRLKLMIGKPGLDGHSNGAEQIAVRARDCGMEIVYDGIRFEPKNIAEKAKSEDVHVIGLSILSGSHIPLVSELINEMKISELKNIPIIIGGIVPEDDVKKLKRLGVSRIYTPKDYDINQIMLDIIKVAEELITKP